MDNTKRNKLINDWKKQNCKKMTFTFQYSTDKDILDYLDQVESKLGTTKQALREHMQNHK